MKSITPVGSGYGAELARVIRNECRTFMTRSTEFITAEQQLNWWNTLDHTKHKLYLFWNFEFTDSEFTQDEEVGFGYIRIEDDCVLLTGGLTAPNRGRGFGTYLFKTLVDFAMQYNKPIRLEVLKTNFAGIRTYQKVGFKIINENDKIIQMEYVNDPTI